MIINGTIVRPHELSYDKILKYALEQSKEMTIKFINGLFFDDISLDAPVEWLKTEIIDASQNKIVADLYPMIDGKMYAIEVEQDGSGDMAIRATSAYRCSTQSARRSRASSPSQERRSVQS